MKTQAFIELLRLHGQTLTTEMTFHEQLIEHSYLYCN
jgi:hypothetical protein